MAYVKGQSGNLAGRPKGRKNKSTDDLRQSVSLFVNKNWRSVQKDFNQMEAKDRLLFIDRLLKYVLPSLMATNVNMTNNVEGLSTEQVDDLFERITENI